MYNHFASVFVSFEISRRIPPLGESPTLTHRLPSALMECFVLPTVASHCLTQLRCLARWVGDINYLPVLRAVPQFRLGWWPTAGLWTFGPTTPTFIIDLGTGCTTDPSPNHWRSSFSRRSGKWRHHHNHHHYHPLNLNRKLIYSHSPSQICKVTEVLLHYTLKI